MNAAAVEQLSRAIHAAMPTHRTAAGIAFAIEPVVIEPLRHRIAELETAAGLVAEYRVPTGDGKWLSVRREPCGNRWLIAQSFGHSPMRVWTGERWTSWGLAGDAELWAYDSADAALSEATRLAALPGSAS